MTRQGSTGQQPGNRVPALPRPSEMVVGRVASGVEPRPAFPFPEYALRGVKTPWQLVGPQLPASRTQTVVMDRRTVTKRDVGEQGAVP